MRKRPRILWLHTQPEHYHNCMLDDLALDSPFEYVAGFCTEGGGAYKDYPVPRTVPTVFLKPRLGAPSRAGFFGKFHENWRRDLEQYPYDVAIVSGYGGRTQREVILDCHRRGIPVAMWSDSNIRSQRGRGRRAVMKRKLKRLMLARLIQATDVMLTANSRGVAYWRYYGASKGKIILSPCYSDYARIEIARRSDRKECTDLLQLPAGDRYLFTAARLAPVKGLDLMIRAFHAAGLAQRGWHYCIAGMGPLEADLKALAGESLGKSIHFLGFQQPERNLTFMAHADLLVLPSIYEPHGIVIPEALAAGTPVLASDVCGAAFDLIDRGISGDMFRSGDAVDLRKKLESLLGNPEHLAAMRVGARQSFERWFAAFSPIDVVERVVTRLLDAHKPAP